MIARTETFAKVPKRTPDHTRQHRKELWEHIPTIASDEIQERTAPATDLFEASRAATSERTACPPTIYAVDNEAGLTELYTLLLEPKGYRVRAFNDRAQALAALKAARQKPDLLITDYLGHTTPVDGFIQRCLLVHPELRILMASGLNEVDARFCQVKPDRFIQKPFTAEEFLQEVKAALKG